MHDTKAGTITGNEDAAQSNTKPPLALDVFVDDQQFAVVSHDVSQRASIPASGNPINDHWHFSHMSMLGTFNQVLVTFQKLATQYQPQVHIREHLAEDLELEKQYECSISIVKIYKAAGSSSGLSVRLKELFGKNSRWLQAWIRIKHVFWSRIKDIWWR